MLSVFDLLRDCSDDARDGSLGTVSVLRDGPGYAAARRTFLAAGLAALPDDRPGSGWVQFNIPCGAEGRAGLYRRLADMAPSLLVSGAAVNFFFMHKPPGLRVRFEAPGPGERDALREELTARLGGAGASAPSYVVYEPETYLFGGPRSMPHVHRLFTADSLAWLDHHRRAGHTAGSAPADWRVSLSLLRGVFEGLGIVGWEHRGVWEAIREDTGRRLTGGLTAPGARAAAEGIRAYWRESGNPGAADGAAEDPAGGRGHRRALRRAAGEWREGYFESGDAVLGPRRAAAYAVIFHWNRAAFSPARQSLLTAALADDPGSRDD